MQRIMFRLLVLMMVMVVVVEVVIMMVVAIIVNLVLMVNKVCIQLDIKIKHSTESANIAFN